MCARAAPQCRGSGDPASGNGWQSRLPALCGSGRRGANSPHNSIRRFMITSVAPASGLGPLQPGQVVALHYLVQAAGEPAHCGWVYRALDQRTQQPVIIKCLPQPLSPQARAYFAQVQRCRSRVLLPILEISEPADQLPMLIIEAAPGRLPTRQLRTARPRRSEPAADCSGITSRSRPTDRSGHRTACAGPASARAGPALGAFTRGIRSRFLDGDAGIGAATRWEDGGRAAGLSSAPARAVGAGQCRHHRRRRPCHHCAHRRQTGWPGCRSFRPASHRPCDARWCRASRR